ncbi:MAG: V-type ATP synthase subunit D [Candidatus Hadarchaeum sp.]|uniref:V-type ATP synthase subunit D n=1 Tax=Candidatus Hadarchaeum sp. TaxID=2883567 RepID=UPI003D0C99E3
MAARINVSPNRMELLKVKNRLALAEKGYDLLKEKMDALVMELLNTLKIIQKSKAEAITQLKRGYEAVSICMATLGTFETVQAAAESKKEINIDIYVRNIMGIEVPTIQVAGIERNALARGYSLHTTSSLLDIAAEEMERAIKLLIELAELEVTAISLARELEKTKRRVNALEYILIPRLRESMKFIMMRLDELERENFTRLKRIKAILEKRE